MTTTYTGKLTLEYLSKEDVCLRLSERFPAVAANINVEALAGSSTISVRRVQSEFWREMCRQIPAHDDGNFVRTLVGAEYYKFSDRMGEICNDWYLRKTCPLLLLSDFVFFSDVWNLAFEHNESLELHAESLDNVYIHSMDLSSTINPSALIKAAETCRREAECLKSTFGDGQEYRLFWHGTSGASARGIVNEQKLRQSGHSGPEGNDFGRGVYAVKEVLHALSFAVDRAYYRGGGKGKWGSPVITMPLFAKRDGGWLH